MNMEKLFKKAIWLVILVPPVYLTIVWNLLPASVPMHFNLEGYADRYGSRYELLTMIIILTVLNAAIYLLLPNIYRIDPKRYAVENKSRLFRISCAVVIFLVAVLCMIIYSSVRANIKAGIQFMIPALGLLFTIIGNYMYTIKPNYFAGFRLPWTLHNDENWRKTHLLGGKLFFWGGLLIAICGLFTSIKVSMIFMLVMLTLTILIPCIYSYRLYKKQSAGISSH